MSSLFGKSSSDAGDSLPVVNSPDANKDPWIIPSRTSASTQVFPGDWGEAVAAKPCESDDYDTPTKDWFRSQTTTSRIADDDPFKGKKWSLLGNCQEDHEKE
jgi:hypothetical protein